MSVKFGIMADLHSDFIHDSTVRTAHFFDTCLKNNADFCVQLGDFLTPGEANNTNNSIILNQIANFPKPMYHCLGNHDMDNHSKSEILSYLNMPSPYYSFDCNGYHFVILDSCTYRHSDITCDYNKGDYKKSSEADISVMSLNELNWLRQDLANTGYPSVVFSHHSLIESRTSITNSSEIRSIFEKAPNRVIAALCGHEHLDRVEEKNGIWYICINSMSYYWAGETYEHTTYGKEIEKSHPLLKYVFPYSEPVYAMVEIDRESLSITGTKSRLVGAAPKDMNFIKKGLVDEITSGIEDKILKISNI